MLQASARQRSRLGFFVARWRELQLRFRRVTASPAPGRPTATVRRRFPIPADRANLYAHAADGDF